VGRGGDDPAVVDRVGTARLGRLSSRSRPRPPSWDLFAYRGCASDGARPPRGDAVSLRPRAVPRCDRRDRSRTGDGLERDPRRPDTAARPGASPDPPPAWVVFTIVWLGIGHTGAAWIVFVGAVWIDLYTAVPVDVTNVEAGEPPEGEAG
jgi:hypothetical protein